METMLCLTLLQMEVSRDAFIIPLMNLSPLSRQKVKISVCFFSLHWFPLSYRAEVFGAWLVRVWRLLLQTFWRQEDVAPCPGHLQGSGCWTRIHPLDDRAELAGKLPVHGYGSRKTGGESWFIDTYCINNTCMNCTFFCPLQPPVTCGLVWTTCLCLVCSPGPTNTWWPSPTGLRGNPTTTMGSVKTVLRCYTRWEK